MRQAFAWWSFSYGRDASEAEFLLRAAAGIGYDGVEMLPEPLWGAAAEAGLEVVTLTGHDLDVGFNDPVNHSATRGITLLLETFNSKVDHPGAQCDHSAWGLEVVRRVGSPALRLLYDCYHMQIMEGDLLRTLKANLDWVGHIHTGGVPGRRDLDDRQEVNWRAIAGLLWRQNYAGWVGHEFIPRGDPRAALQQAYDIFNRIDSEANH